MTDSDLRGYTLMLEKHLFKKEDEISQLKEMVANLEKGLKPVIKFYNDELPEPKPKRLTAKQKEDLEIEKLERHLEQQSILRVKQEGLIYSP